jgi:hypothetical protein
MLTCLIKLSQKRTVKMPVAALASKPTVISEVEHRDTGEQLFSLKGRYPMYFHKLLFETREIAEEAKEEAEWVLENEERPDESKFMDAYFKTNENSESVIIRE